MLSALSADDLRFAVLADDAKTIAKAPGIGLKTAQKLILELKDKLSLEEAFEARLENSQAKAAAGAAPDLSEARNEAVEALTALGYSRFRFPEGCAEGGSSRRYECRRYFKSCVKIYQLLGDR